LIRKGAVKVHPGEVAVIPSHVSGEVALVEATRRIEETLFSMSHGTGRLLSRSDSKKIAFSYDFSKIRNSILLPSSLQDASLATEGPYAYRNLNDCLTLIDGYIKEIKRFSVVAYAGHL